MFVSFVYIRWSAVSLYKCHNCCYFYVTFTEGRFNNNWCSLNIYYCFLFSVTLPWMQAYYYIFYHRDIASVFAANLTSIIKSASRMKISSQFCNATHFRATNFNSVHVQVIMHTHTNMNTHTHIFSNTQRLFSCIHNYIYSLWLFFSF